VKDVPNSTDNVDLGQLMKLRLVVARVGEMDNAGWWNTRGLLGKLGNLALARGFPQSRCFSQARAVFAVAAARCSEVFSPPGCMTLWRLPSDLEAQFDLQWPAWTTSPKTWNPFFARIESLQSLDVLASLIQFGLIDPRQAEQARRLRRAADGRAVPLPGVQQSSNDVVTLLAAGFSKSEKGHLAVPYVRME
jgi:hypothetical protein